MTDTDWIFNTSSTTASTVPEESFMLQPKPPNENVSQPSAELGFPFNSTTENPSTENNLPVGSSVSNSFTETGNPSSTQPFNDFPTGNNTVAALSNNPSTAGNNSSSRSASDKPFSENSSQPARTSNQPSIEINNATLRASFDQPLTVGSNSALGTYLGGSNTALGTTFNQPPTGGGNSALGTSLGGSNTALGTTFNQPPTGGSNSALGTSLGGSNPALGIPFNEPPTGGSNSALGTSLGGSNPAPRTSFGQPSAGGINSVEGSRTSLRPSFTENTFMMASNLTVPHDVNDGRLSPGSAPSSHLINSRYGGKPVHPSYGGVHDQLDTDSSGHPSWSTYHPSHGPTKVDRNTFKRNMTIAKGFLDIGLFSANCNQLRNVISLTREESPVFYITITLLSISILLQMVTGVLLIVTERFNINKPHHQDRSLRLNNASVCLIFFTLVINVIITSFGVDVKTNYHPQQYPYDQRGLARSNNNVTVELL